MTAKKMLCEILNDLSPEELDKFKSLIELEKDIPPISRSRLKAANTQDTVELMMETYSEECVELTKKILKKMNRTDLVKRLSDTGSGSKEKQWPSLIQRVETMTAKKMLCEILNDLSPEELDKFKSLIELEKDIPPISRSRLKAANTQDTVELMMETYSEECVELTKKILKKMNRTDLVKRLSDTGSGSKEKQWPSLIQRVETMTAKKMLCEILNDLSPEELDKFKSLIELEKDIPPISRSRQKAANTQDTVELMVETYSEECVELTKKILKKMNRTDLVQRLSDTGSGSKEKQRPSLIQRVETIASVIKQLLETLAGMGDKELEKFKKVLSQVHQHEHFSNIQRRLRNTTDVQDIVFLMVQIDGQQSVETTKEVLKKMKRTDLVQKLSDSSSGPKKKHSVDEHLSALIHKVATVRAVKELLLETLGDLSYEETEKFQWLLQFTFFQRSIELLSWGELSPAHIPGIQEEKTSMIHDVTDVMLERCGQQSVEVAMEVLMDMNRTDLVQRLSETSSGHKAAGSSAEAFGVSTMEGEKHCVDEHCPVPIQRVETMMSVIELLLETLAGLSDVELEKFKKVLLSQTDFSGGLSDMSLMLPEIKDRQVTVFLMVLTDGQQSVEMTKEVLEKMERTDLVQRLSDSSSGPKKQHSDEHRPALIQKVATMAAATQLLLETLNGLSDKELEEFKEFLQWIIFRKYQTEMSSPFRLTEDRTELVGLMLEAYSQQSVQLTREAVKKMNRTDLLQKFSDSSSELKEKHPVGEHQPEVLGEAAAMEAVKNILLETLKDLNKKELQKFNSLLQFTYFQKGLPLTSWSSLKQASSAAALVNLMVENQQSLEVTKEVFMDMNRTDLVKKLSVISSKFKDYNPTVTVFSPKAALMKFGFSVKINCVVLIYKSYRPFLTFHVYLIPQDPALQQEVDKRELSYGFTQILKPHPEKPLKMRDCFTLTADVDGAKIFPETLELRYDSTGPNFYEVFVKNPDKKPDFKLMLTPKNGHQPVWTCEIRKDDYQRSTGPLQEKHQSEPLHKEVTVTPLMQKLLETLKDLSYGELKQFKHVLQRTRMTKGLPKISSQRMEMADRDEIAELMVEIYGDQSVEVTREVLMEMNMTDLAERLLEISLGSKGSSGSSELEGCGSVTQDSSDWTKLDPEVNCTDADEAPTYSLQSGAGNFECSVSGLRWVCKEKVSFKYQFCSLSGHLERIESMKYMPAGPLMDITVTAGKLDVVYLPHWICIYDNPKILDKFAVLHIDDCGDVVEKVSEVTSSHVKLSEPVFSLKMVLVKLGLPVEIYCRVLIYSKVLTASSQTSLTLHVYLIPPDQDLIKVLDKTETSDRYKGIRKSNPAKPLKMHDWFILTTDLDGADIYPKGEEPQTLKLRYNSTDPNFYEVVVKNPDKDFKLMLTPKNGHQPVWTSEILKGEWQSTGHVQVTETAGQSSMPGPSYKKHSVDKHQEAAITVAGEKLLNMLKELKSEEFKEFKWRLPRITEYQRENTDRVDLVNLMLQTYSQESVEVAKDILKKIPRNDLVQLLSDTSSGSEAAGSSA
ncbi:uncharacterized protein LOC117265830 isoform X1 [Epinephelus lanceolatus]